MYNLLNSHYDSSQAIVRKYTCDSTGWNAGPWHGKQARYPYTTAPLSDFNRNTAVCILLKPSNDMNTEHTTQHTNMMF